MIRRPPRSTLSSSSAASDVYKRQPPKSCLDGGPPSPEVTEAICRVPSAYFSQAPWYAPVSYTHLRAHETPEHLVCRLLLEKKKKKNGRKTEEKRIIKNLKTTRKSSKISRRMNEFKPRQLSI
eukprot:TRINITY_DN13907_c0_g1_i3.p1 TRINITY_DN13907_c0_g1~~TRINITY_DN13907_c0_g1_i3.p1  ORF type:complete len:123 (+),score=16.75 TRINITY_DN13907_c0_g1_i3:147-515(+)